MDTTTTKADAYAVACAAIDAMRPFVYATNAVPGLDAYATDPILRAIRGCYLGLHVDGWVVDSAMQYMDDNSYETSAHESLTWALEQR